MRLARSLDVVGERREVHRQDLYFLLLGCAACILALQLRFEHVGQADGDLIAREGAKKALAGSVRRTQKLGAKARGGRIGKSDYWRYRMPEPTHWSESRKQREQRRGRREIERGALRLVNPLSAAELRAHPESVRPVHIFERDRRRQVE